MALPDPEGANYPTPADVLQTLIRAIRFAFARRGIDVNVLPDSDHYKRAQTYANRVALAIANNQLALADSNPLTSTGDALVALAGIFGVEKRPAAAAAGFVTITCTGTVVIPAEYLLSSPDGQKYQTTKLGTYTTGQEVEIIATVGGSDTNQEAGTVLTWDSASIGALSRNATVTADALTGGAAEDNDDTLRNRLLAKLAAPAVGGNSSSVVEWAEDASASVEHAYVYQAARGPGSYDVAVTAAGGDRTLSTAILDLVEAAVLAKMPGQSDLLVTTVTPQYVDIVLAAMLPLPQSAGGAGGGWRDATPWPAEDVKVISYNSGGGLARVQVSSTAAAPSVGASIGIWDPDAEAMNEYSITGVTLIASGPPATYDISVQNGFLVDPTDAYVSAGAQFLTDYADTFAGEVAKLGPGQKTDLPEILPRALRFPATDTVSPSDLTSRQTIAVFNTYSEVADLTYSARYATGTTTSLTSPDLPLTTADPPNILVLKYLAFRKA
jgi:uncharacterized phage protein gp47/JayE